MFRKIKLLLYKKLHWKNDIEIGASKNILFLFFKMKKEIKKQLVGIYFKPWEMGGNMTEPQEENELKDWQTQTEMESKGAHWEF